MTNNTNQKAVIYCRVSSLKQTTKGDGLGSQETRCREYAKYKGYTVTEVFKDDVSGGMIDRPAMRAMLSHLKKHRIENSVIIIDDISRLARGLEAHLQLRTAISAAGGKLESPSIEFGEDSDSILVENLLASVSQHQRQKNGEQTRNRMRARSLNGYWVFQAPIGYRYERVSGHGKMLIRNEPIASIIQEALEGYAGGRFETQVEVKRFLESRADFPKNRKNAVHYQRVHDILTRIVYAGFIDKPDWGIKLQPAKHEPLIAYETYRAVQKRLTATTKAPARKDLSSDFPLRGFITCGGCNKPMTACWSKGRNATYPYYMCATKGCADYRKSIRKETLEGEFETLLHELRPSEYLFNLAVATFRDQWEEHRTTAAERSDSIKRKLNGVERKIDQFMDRIVDTDSHRMITAYERKIDNLEEQKAELTENIAHCGRPLQGFDETFRTAIEFLGNPQKLWASNRLEDKRAVLRMAFADKLPYVRNEGFRTAPTAPPFLALQQLKAGEKGMVRPTGLEPVAS